MTVNIKVAFFPFRMYLKRKEPVELVIEIKNNSDKTKLLSMQLAASRVLSLDTSGINKGAEQKIGELAPGQSTKLKYEVFAKPTADYGEYPVRVKVFEHYNSYDYIMQEYTKNVKLKIEE